MEFRSNRFVKDVAELCGKARQDKMCLWPPFGDPVSILRLFVSPSNKYLRTKDRRQRTFSFRQKMYGDEEESSGEETFDMHRKLLFAEE